VRVCILGNSVPLVVAPSRKRRDDLTYSEILRSRGHAVDNAARQSMMITDLYRSLEEDCLARGPGMVVMHFGIVEATMRVRSRHLQNHLTANAWKNVISGTHILGPYSRALAHAVRRVVRAFERPVFVLGFARPWVTPRMFEFALLDVVKSVFKDTAAEQVVLIGMPKCPEWLEREAPGTSRMVETLNGIMARAAETCGDVHFLDVQRAPGGEGATADGIHFTAAGHLWIAEQLHSLAGHHRQDFELWKGINQYAGTRFLTHLRRT
jgi:hypothetical protein